MAQALFRTLSHADVHMKLLVLEFDYTDFHQMFLFWSLTVHRDVIDIGISHSLYFQAPKKAVFYENQHIEESV
ncbi:MAG: hypothetical protein LBU32_15890 [Clostridiales bacterium]|nr:hypothetical protein [Clostridiales bacterium]